MRRLPLLLALFASGTATAERQFTIEAPAPWVEVHPLEAAPSAHENATGAQHLLEEEQTRVTATGVDRYVRYARRVLSPTGMESVSEIEITFAPEYQRLTLHEVWIHRGSQRLNALFADEVRVIQQEKELERRIYNGSLTAVVFVKDVRVGDIIEAAYTVSGQNSILAGRYASSFWLASGHSIGHLSQRLLYPESRPLFLKKKGTAVSPAVSLHDGVREYRWDLREVSPVTSEDRLPPSFDPWPRVQVSSFANWGEVAGWAVELFTPPADTPEAAAQAEALVEEWRKAHPTAEGRFLAAVRFVQDDVRYLGMSIGANSHRPHAPAQVLSQRFGDCKDKALLLVTLLGRLGIPAVPALVSADTQRGIEEDLPGPYSFDHAIVRAMVDGQEVWVDATASLQRGRLAARPPPPFERALLVSPDTTALVTIPSPNLDAPTIEVEERYDVLPGGTATLDIRSRYLGDEALAMRHRFAGTPLDELQRHYLNRYARKDPAITVSRPLEVTDDPDTNIVEVQQHYAIEGFWREKGRYFSATEVESELHSPSVSVRSFPLAISPANLRQVIEVRLPESVPSLPEDAKVEGPATVMTLAATETAAHLRIEFAYRTTADRVEPNAIKRHLESVETMRNLDVFIPAPAMASAMSGEELGTTRERNLLISLALLVTVGLVFAYPRLQRLRRARSAKAMARERERRIDRN